MDPDQENQGENSAAGANRQAIFTPQPEQPEAVPGTGIPAQPSVDLSHPYFSNHPTQTFNTEVGDIILNTGTPKPKQNKRPFIIGGIILAVFAVALVVVLVASKAAPTSKNTYTVSDAEINFNQFATYLLYGKEGNSLSGEYESDKSYEIDLQLESEEFDNGYWERASELLGKAITSAEDDGKITRYLVKSLQNYKQYFDFIKQYRRIGKFDETRLLSSYLSDGANSARAIIDNFYNKFSDSDFNIEKNYVENRKQQYYNAIEIYAVYERLGCIHNGKIDENSCARAASTDVLKRFEDLSSIMNREAMLADKHIQDSVTYLKGRCWDLSIWLQNPVDERDQEDNNEE